MRGKGGGRRGSGGSSSSSGFQQVAVTQHQCTLWQQQLLQYCTAHPVLSGAEVRGVGGGDRGVKLLIPSNSLVCASCPCPPYRLQMKGSARNAVYSGGSVWRYDEQAAASRSSATVEEQVVPK